MLVYIAGMRSGTSMLTGVLSDNGFWVGEEEDLLAPSTANEKGFYEDLGIVNLNDRILHEAGGSWDVPPPEEIVATVGQAFRPEISQKLKELTKRRQRVALKDPRFCLTLESWVRESPEQPKVILQWRD